VVLLLQTKGEHPKTLRVLSEPERLFPLKIEPDALTGAELAQRLNVTPQTVYLWRKKGTGPQYVTVQNGQRTRYLYLEADLVVWLESERP
jgi:hypothetical protein